VRHDFTIEFLMQTLRCDSRYMYSPRVLPGGFCLADIELDSLSSKINVPLFGEEMSLMTQMQKGFTRGS